MIVLMIALLAGDTPGLFTIIERRAISSRTSMRFAISPSLVVVSQALLPALGVLPEGL